MPTLHLMTVGTSLIMNQKNTALDIYPYMSECKKSYDFPDKRPPNYALWYSEELKDLTSNLGKFVDKAYEFMLNEQFKDSAEMSYFYAYYGLSKDGDTLTHCDKDKVLLIASDSFEGTIAAMLLQKYFTDHNHNSKKREYQLVQALEKVDVKSIPLMDATSGSQRFQKEGLANYAQIIRGYVDKPENENHNLVLNVTGGFKGVIPYTTLLGSFFKDKHRWLSYLFEQGEVITIPALPLYFDLDSWRDYRGLIQAIGDGNENVRGIIEALPEQLRTAYQPYEDNPNRYKRSFLIDWMEQAYKSKSNEGTKYGRGLILSNYLGEEYRETYEKNISRWQYGWIGDYVPEMVEHQRGHTQRILEFAAELIVPILADKIDFFSKSELYALLCAIWLHDIGHSVPSFKLPNGKMHNVSGLPTLVREYHHLMAAYQLDGEAEKITRSNNNECTYFSNSINKDADIIQIIAQITRYHRQMMPLLGVGAIYDAWKETSKDSGVWRAISTTKVGSCKVIDEVFSEECPSLHDSSSVRLKLLAALYRILDASDVQAERVGNEDMIELRKSMIKHDSEVLLEKLKDLNDVLPNDKPIYRYDNWPENKDHLIKVLEGIITDPKNAVLKDKATDWAKEASIDLLSEESRGNKDVIYRGWLSVATSIIFKSIQPTHYEKHRGVHTIVYKYDGTESKDYKTVFKFNVEATVESEDKLNAGLRALNEIKGEYWGVKSVLENIIMDDNKYAIRFVNLFDNAQINNSSVKFLKGGDKK